MIGVASRHHPLPLTIAMALAIIVDKNSKMEENCRKLSSDKQTNKLTEWQLAAANQSESRTEK